MSLSDDQIVAFIAEHPDGVSTAQVGDHFRLRPAYAASKCSRLASWGVIDKRFIRRESKIPGTRAVWRAKV